MSKPRNSFKYNFKIGNKIVRVGSTSNLVRRESERKRDFPQGHILQVGRRTTKGAAYKWAREQRSHIKS